MDKSMASGNTPMLVLKLLEEKDMYGYEMIEFLAKKSDNTFELKAGTLYPILHGLKRDGAIEDYEDDIKGGRVRRYYHITDYGKKLLKQKERQWNEYSSAVNNILRGGLTYEF